MDEWTVISRRHKKCRSKHIKTLECSVTLPDFSGTIFNQEDLNQEIQKVKMSMKDLRMTVFCSKTLDLIRHALSESGSYNSFSQIHEVVCYGLGSVSNSYISRFQLALLLILVDHLNNQDLQVPHLYVYDPIFNALDIEIIKSFGIELIPHNEEGRRKVDCSLSKKISLFYMIHCDKPLYNNLLQCNFGNCGFSQLLIIGNSFNAMKDRLSEKALKNEFNFIYSALSNPSLQESPLPFWSDNDTIFNDTSVHYFKST